MPSTPLMRRRVALTDSGSSNGSLEHHFLRNEHLWIGWDEARGCAETAQARSASKLQNLQLGGADHLVPEVSQ
jgi:hypothetical protein